MNNEQKTAIKNQDISSFVKDYSPITNEIRMKIERFNTSQRMSKQYLANLELSENVNELSDTLLFNLSAYIYRQEIDEVYHEYPASLWDTVKLYLPQILKKLFKPPMMNKLKIEYAILYPQLERRKHNEEFSVFAFKESSRGYFGESK